MDFIFTLNLETNLVILGDLNMDLSAENEQNINLLEFLLNNNLNQAVNQPTRICAKYYEKSKKFNCTKTLIDVLIHNNDIVRKVYNINCPFSDHKFVLAKLDLKKKEVKANYFIGRKLTAKNVNLIVERITELGHFEIMQILDAHSKWICLRDKLLEIIDSVAPIEKIKINNNMNYPWVDHELIETRQLCDKYYKTFRKSENADDFLWYNEAKTNYARLLKNKMIEYFKDKTASDFKNSKKYWQFYESSIKLRSSIKENVSISITVGNETFNDPATVGNLFNNHFTSLSSVSDAEFPKCSDFVNGVFDSIDAKREKITKMFGQKVALNSKNKL